MDTKKAYIRIRIKLIRIQTLIGGDRIMDPWSYRIWNFLLAKLTLETRVSLDEHLGGGMEVLHWHLRHRRKKIIKIHRDKILKGAFLYCTL
jgi:hypothetical protein